MCCEGRTVKESSLLGRLRKICLSLPETRETVKWGHPTFEAGKKIFAVLDNYQGRTCIAFRVPPNRARILLQDDRFFEAPYAAGRGWVCLRAGGKLDWGDIAEFLRESYRQVALKRMVAALEGIEPQKARQRRLSQRGRRSRRA
jgi:predicted DNA-binding protein (MmcQ/YjbR family)